MIADDDALELIDLLCFVADLCRVQDSLVSVALERFVGTGYGADALGEDAARLAEALSQAVGSADLAGHVS